MIQLLFSAVAIFSGIIIWRVTQSSPVLLPPGPPGISYIGTILKFLSIEKPWVELFEWTKKYDSDVVSISLFRRQFIILNTSKAADDLFVKRGLNYSARPRIPILDLVGHSIDWLFLSYSTDRVWRDHRKIYHREFDSQTLLHRPGEIASARKLLRNLLESPENYLNHLRYTVGSTILRTTFGISVKPVNDPIVAILVRFFNTLDIAFGIKTLVNAFPFLRYLPKWLPGTSFYSTANELKRSAINMLEVPLSLVQTDASTTSSIASRVLDSLEGTIEDPDHLYNLQILKNVLAGVYAAGADTTLTAMQWFIFAMVKYPDIQAKAQTAIEQRTEAKRLPDFESDFGALPYIDALVNEVLRFFPVLPLGMPHCAMEEDVYGKYFIPKNAIIFSNSWALLREEQVFGPNTDIFYPERFLNDNGIRNLDIPDPDAAFGYGRRICAGQNVAREFLWIMMVSILSCFNISKAVSKDGTLTEPSGKHTLGLVVHPLPFPCKITPRSTQAEQLLAAIEAHST
ncbi:cytochrome P450 [Gymnopus androsaceus JB14]|uniref:Cytochrome P450 n=1 Tax=Gymnopus androsaceus JB14 TaxID=1447944 RepID=A0A6A4GM08_9AGAR|nr:cytochrome P450 [Gymnopus androsaceus JB14]